jgi:hypothetical protein
MEVTTLTRRNGSSGLLAIVALIGMPLPCRLCRLCGPVAHRRLTFNVATSRAKCVSVLVSSRSSSKPNAVRRGKCSLPTHSAAKKPPRSTAWREWGRLAVIRGLPQQRPLLGEGKACLNVHVEGALQPLLLVTALEMFSS